MEAFTVEKSSREKYSVDSGLFTELRMRGFNQGKLVIWEGLQQNIDDWGVRDRMALVDACMQAFESRETQQTQFQGRRFSVRWIKSEREIDRWLPGSVQSYTLIMTPKRSASGLAGSSSISAPSKGAKEHEQKIALSGVSITALLNAVAERPREAAKHVELLESLTAEIRLTKHAEVFGFTHENVSRVNVNKWLHKNKGRLFDAAQMQEIIEAMKFFKRHWKVKLYDKTNGAATSCSMTAPKANDTETSDLIFKTWKSTGGGLTTSKALPELELKVD